MNIFKKEYVLRKFGEQKIIKGYAHASYNDSIVKLNVHVEGTDDLTVLPEGDRTIKKLVAIGKADIRSADELNGTWADRIFYMDRWYECEGSEIRDNTPIGQTTASFVLLTKNDDELLKSPDIETIRRAGEENDTEQS